MKRPTLLNTWVGVLRMAFRAPNVFATVEKRAPDPISRNLSICKIKLLEPNKLWDGRNFFQGKKKEGRAAITLPL